MVVSLFEIVSSLKSQKLGFVFYLVFLLLGKIVTGLILARGLLLKEEATRGAI